MTDAPVEPDSDPTAATASSAAALAALAEPTVLSSARVPLITDEAGQKFLGRWAEVQVGFVEDPHAAVEAADILVEEIATTVLQAFQERRNELAADWRNGSPDTEQLRLALKRYRAFIGLILPK